MDKLGAILLVTDLAESAWAALQRGSCWPPRTRLV